MTRSEEIIRAAHEGEANMTEDGAGLRERRAAEAMQQQGALLAEIRAEEMALKPMGRMNEWAEVLGVKPKQGVAYSVPGWGTLVFAKDRKPTAEQVEGWERRWARAEAALKEWARLNGCYLLLCMEEGRTIGNGHGLESWLRLEREGLLSPEEVAALRKVEAFWQEYPAAKSGVSQGGRIEPLY